LAFDLALDLAHEGADVLDPLRPRIDVAALALALAVPAQVEGEGTHPPLCHRGREVLVAACVLTQPVCDGKRDRSAGLWPRAKGEPRAVAGGDGSAGGGGFSHRDGRSREGS